MTKRLFSSMLFAFIALWCMAQGITPEVAFQKAQAFMQAKGHSLEQSVASRPNSRRAQGQAAYYVFNAKQQQGFVIVSGDESTEAILGYADEGSFDETALPSNIKAWLESYARQIDALSQGKVEEGTRRVATHAAIAPMTKTKWDQEDPYNLQCPTRSGNIAPTGCSATAMAQVMAYHKWPEASVPSIPSYTIGGYTTSATNAGVIDWANMKDHYTGNETTTEDNAVARLMRLCGQSLMMKYGTSASGAFLDNCGNQLTDIFGYKQGARHIDRANYSAASWDEIIYTELQQERPVIYEGSATGGGHAFVCDGYDGNGFYHINWGWSGRYNGYYKLSVLNPNGGGTGSAGTEDGYTSDQGAVIGIQKPDGTEVQDLRDLTFYMMDFQNNIFLITYFSNRIGSETNFTMGYAYRKSTESNLTYMNLDTKSAKPINNETGQLSLVYAYANLNNIGLTNGATYYFYPYSYIAGQKMTHLAGDGKYYAEVTKNGTSYSVVLHPTPSLSVNNMEIKSSPVVNIPQEVCYTLKNNGDEIDETLYLFASKTNSRPSTPVGLTTAYLEKGQTDDVSLYFTPSSAGTWYLFLCRRVENNYIELATNTVTVEAAPTVTYSLAMSAISGTEENVTATVKNNSSAPYYRQVLVYLTDTKGNEVEQVVSGNVTIPALGSIDVTIPVSQLTSGTTYRAYLFGFASHTATDWKQFGYSKTFTTATTGIDTVSKTTEQQKVIFNLQGQRLAQPQRGFNIIGGRKVIVK